MDDFKTEDDVHTSCDVSPSRSTRMNRIENIEIPTDESIRDTTAYESTPKDDELPDGWVKVGKGLVFDVPITPTMRSARRSPNRPHFVFTQASDSRTTRQLRNTLLEIDRKAMRMMKQENNVKIRANRPTNEQQDTLRQRSVGRCSSVNATRQPAPEPSNRCTRMMRSRAVTPIGQTSNTQNDALDRKIALLKRQHEREVIAAKQQVLDQVDVLVKKYRQLAIDAVRVARDEQHKAEQERRNAYEACARYEADLMTNVRNAIAQLKVSNKAEHERLLAERDALQRRCQDLMPSNTLNGPALDRITAKIISQFHDNQKFNMDLIDDSVDMILKEYVTFQKMAADLMIKKFATRGCTLTNDDATEFVDKAVAVNGLEL